MTTTSRRKLLKTIAVGSGAIVAGKSLPESWSRPVVDTVILPAHAQTSLRPRQARYAIGDTGSCGGIVFYITNGGLNGMEAAREDQGVVYWGCIVQKGATGTSIGDGPGNTATIVGMNPDLCISADLADPDNAAEIASNYAGSGCSGWFLPSKDELNQLFLQKDVVGGFVGSHTHWSSSEFSHFNAWSQLLFIAGGQQHVDDKALMMKVRAVRNF